MTIRLRLQFVQRSLATIPVSNQLIQEKKSSFGAGDFSTECALITRDLIPKVNLVVADPASELLINLRVSIY